MFPRGTEASIDGLWGEICSLSGSDGI